MTEFPCWYKSSHSDNGGQCIEIAANFVASHGVVPVRDSKHPDGPRVAVPADSFTSFVTAVKKGEFGA